jgi:cysteinyl-tRNA synthetase
MDIIRRILECYFGYKVNFVQNVTDIDDKVHSLTEVIF